MSDEQDRLVLVVALEAAVPLWIEQLKRRSWALVDSRRDECMLMIAEHGDDILFRSKKAGGTAKAFNALAEAIAILSFLPGGVKAFGVRWESRHPDLTYPVTDVDHHVG